MSVKHPRIWRDWKKAEAKLPQDPITPEIEQRIVSQIRALRRAEIEKTSPLRGIVEMHP